MNINEIATKLKKFFDKNRLQQSAKECGFIKRERKITADKFVESIVIAAVRDDASSLPYLSSLFDDSGITVTKQALAKKINEQAVEFIKEIFESLCENFIDKKFLGIDSKFTDIVIVDSSEIKLSKKLTEFKSIRNGPRCKGQAIYGLLSNSFSCKITRANKNDQGYKDYLDHVQKNNLVTVDLGYFSLENFRIIMEKEAFFVSRLLKTTKLKDCNGEEFDLFSMLKSGENTIDMKVLVGKTEELPCRLVATKLEGEALEKRLKKIRLDVRKSGRTRKELSEMDFWSVYITNLQQESVAEMHRLYALRWQIELLFKVLKSKLSMGYIKDNNADKAMLMLYGKLIVLVIAMILTSTINNVEISLYKAIDYYKERIKKAYMSCVKGATKKLEELVLKLQIFALKSKTKKRPSSLERSPLQILFSSS